MKLKFVDDLKESFEFCLTFILLFELDSRYLVALGQCGEIMRYLYGFAGILNILVSLVQGIESEVSFCRSHK